LKKGAYDFGRKAIYLIVVVLIVAFVILYFRGLLVGNSAEVISNVNDIEREIIVQNMLFSPDCLAYKDDLTGRVYPGIVDFKKFSDKIGKNCLKFIDQKVKLALIKGDEPSSYGSFKGSTVERRTVIVKEGNDYYNALLEVAVAK